MKKWLFTVVLSLAMLAGYSQGQVNQYAHAADSAQLAAIKVREKLGALHPDYATALYNLADIYCSMDRFTESEALLHQVLTIRKSALGEQHADYATTLSTLGLLNRVLGHSTIAESYYLQALSIQKAVLGVEHEDYIETLKELALLREDQNKIPVLLYEELLAIQKKKLGEQDPEYVSTLIKLARAYQALEVNAKAELLYQQLVSQRKAQFGEHHVEYAAALQRQADLYRETGRDNQAEQLYRQILQIRKEKLGDKDDTYAQALFRLGFLYKKMGRTADAIRLLEQTERIYREKGNRSDLGYLSLLQVLAKLYDQVGRLPEAVATQARAVEQQEQDQSRELESIQVKDASYLLYSDQQSIDVYHSLVLRLRERQKSQPPTGTGTAFNHELFLKGHILATTINNKHQILASGDTTLIRRYTQLQALRRRYADAHALTLLERRHRGWNTAELEGAIKPLEQEMIIRTAALKGSNPHPTWQQVQQALKPGEAAIELARYTWYSRSSKDTIYSDTTYYAAYILTPNNKEPELVVLKNGAALEEQYAKAYLRLTSGPGGHRGAVVVPQVDSGAPTIDSKELYRALWEPIAQALPAGTTSVYFSPVGMYQQINLATLQNPVTGKFVLDEVGIRLVGSTREILDRASQSPTASSGESVLIGAPTYRLAADHVPPSKPVEDKDGFELVAMAKGTKGPDPNYAGRYEADDHFLEDSNIASLPGTKKEIDELNTLLKTANWSARCFTGDAATEEQVMAVHRPRVLHIATHGFTLRHVSRFSNARQSDSTYLSVARARDPLLRCGLLLAGVSNYRDAEIKPTRADGILTAYEASLLDLEGTELVVLSACETGLGELSYGEGVYGLQRGFVMAGAKSIMVSLWKVDDDVTRELMVAFYKNWLSGQTKRAALVNAQQLVRSKHPSPFYWGAFLLFGE